MLIFKDVRDHYFPTKRIFASEAMSPPVVIKSFVPSFLGSFRSIGIRLTSCPTAALLPLPKKSLTLLMLSSNHFFNNLEKR